MRRSVPVITAFLIQLAAVTIPSLTLAARSAEDVDHLQAFARLYGYVRFFHPSDEASRIDWDRFAIYGAREVLATRSPEDLEATLKNLFEPIAPTVKISRGPASAPQLPSFDDRSRVYWQHLGPGSVSQRDTYSSARVNAPNEAKFGSIGQGVDATAYRNKQIRLSAAVNAIELTPGSTAQLWVRVDRPNRQPGFFDNMSDRPVTTRGWNRYEITGEVDGDAEKIAFGGFLAGEGRAAFDSFSLQVREGDSWVEIPLNNAGFEEAQSSDSPAGWAGGSQAYRYQSMAIDPHSGSQALLIEHARLVTEPIFSDGFEETEIVKANLGSGLQAQIPLTLPGTAEGTLPPADQKRFESLQAHLSRIDRASLRLTSEDVRVADVIITWNVLQHFYPYFDVIEAEWDEVLPTALRQALEDQTDQDFFATVQEMLAELHDGHALARMNLGWARLPFNLDWVEDEAVVVAVAPESPVQIGDRVISLNGVPAVDVLDTLQRSYSGSPQWRRRGALQTFGMGKRGTAVDLVVERDGERLNVKIVRNSVEPERERRPESITELQPGLAYVDLSRADMESIEERIDWLSAADGVIFDLRGYPKRNHDVLSYLSDKPLESAQWLVPKVLRPDRRAMSFEHLERWFLEPLTPRISGEIVFLTDASAISYSESIMGIVEHYHLGTIVGQTTAATNGNVSFIDLPGGISISWTGMKVLKHDGSQHHLIGIAPDVPVERTIEGVRQGRDEVLDKGVEVLLQKIAAAQPKQ